MKDQKKNSNFKKNGKKGLIVLILVGIASFMIGFGVCYLLSDNGGLGGGFNASAGGGCTACKSGYYLSGGNCIKNTCPIIKGCVALDPIKCTCQKCSNSYTLSNGKCVATCNIAHCSVYKSKSPCICQTCRNGYTLSNGKCVETCNIAHCSVYKSKSPCICQTCRNDYTLSNGKCVK